MVIVSLLLGPWLPTASADKRRGLTPVPLDAVTLEPGFWAAQIEKARTVTLADVLMKLESDGAMVNFDRVCEGGKGDHRGPPWLDGLLYETVRAAADFLAQHPDSALEQRLDGYIARIATAAAVDPDGYIATYTQLERPTQRFGDHGGDDTWQHDLYNAGGLIEAAVHHYRVTGKTSLLAVAARFASYLCSYIGPEPKKNLIPGHSLPEEALVKLYRLFRDEPALRDRLGIPVDERQYLRLVEFWVDVRGNYAGRKPHPQPEYNQDHLPLLRQRTAEGHAVRACLCYAGLVAAGLENGRAEYLAAAERLWTNLHERKAYITGGVGSTAAYEGFGPDYFLPNDGYLETCGAVAAGFFDYYMGLAFADGRYVDELERELYNGVLTGVSLGGDSYFYENPLESRGRQRWKWHSCPCCPPMFLKIVAESPSYIYACDASDVYVNLYVAGRATVPVAGTKVELQQATAYPWDGRVDLTVRLPKSAQFALYLRIPGWCGRARLAINGAAASVETTRGYGVVRRTWQDGDAVRLDLPMPVQRVRAHPRVQANIGRVALQRGPLIYCAEQVDNEVDVRRLALPPDAPLTTESRLDLLGGVTVIRGTAQYLPLAEAPPKSLYEPVRPGAARAVPFIAIPYYTNSNRGGGSLAVWFPVNVDLLPAPAIAERSRVTASVFPPGEPPTAVHDGREPSRSHDTTIPRFSWWDHRGTKEWIQYDFDAPRRVRAVSVYWYDDTGEGSCRPPKSWTLLYKDGDAFEPVTPSGPFGTERDQFNRVEFASVETAALRIEVQLQPDVTAGLLEWQVE